MTSINILCWNCNGVSNVGTLNQIRDLINLKKPSLVYLMEIRADKGKTSHFWTNFSIRWN